jgi:hypothetical protein
MGLDRFALIVFDYGAPIGFRIATHDPGWKERTPVAQLTRDFLSQLRLTSWCAREGTG